MKTQILWAKPILAACALSMSVACVDAPENTARPDGVNVNVDGEVIDENTQRALFLSGANGGAFEAGDNGLVDVEVRVARFADLQSIGFEASVDGAEIAEWERMDSFLTAAGGQLVPLEQKIENGKLRMVLGTTRAVQSDEANGEVVARLVLRPTANTVSVSLRADSSDLGVVSSKGERVSVDAFSTTFSANDLSKGGE